MTTREKIIVGMMCLTVVYGAYELLGSKTAKKRIPPSKENPIGELKTFVAEIGQKLNNERITKEYSHTIDQAGAAWDKDPFILSSSPLKKRPDLSNATRQPESAGDVPGFAYTGFMQLGNTIMAIIDGTEYTAGEALPDKTFYVKSISPQRVIIGRLEGLGTIQLPIKELDSGSAE
jgi:hypothetical protein